MYPAEAALHLPDASNRTRGVQDLRLGIFHVLTLGYGEYQVIVLPQRCFDSPERPRPSCSDGRGHAREHHRLPQRQHREAHPSRRRLLHTPSPYRLGVGVRVLVRPWTR